MQQFYDMNLRQRTRVRFGSYDEGDLVSLQGHFINDTRTFTSIPMLVRLKHYA